MAEGRVVVVGGGLAGIAAALRLADAGRQVVLLEKRPRLGGAAFSFRRGGLTIDNGQHVFLRCCTAYRGLLARLRAGADTVLQQRLDIPVLHPDGRQARISRLPGVPAPAHLGAALARYALLSPADRVRAARGALALRRLDPADRRLDGDTLGAFLRRHGQNDATIGRLWGIIATATLNLPPDEASLALAAKVFRTGLLDRADAADVGYAAVPLARVHHDAALRELGAAGVDVRLSTGVDEARADGTVRTDAGVESGDAVVLAVPHRAAVAVAPELPSPAGLGASPIVNVHVVYDRKVTDLPFAAAVASPVQWLFDRTASAGLAAGQYLAVTVSAADSIAGSATRTLTERFVAELARLLPGARKATVRDAFVTRERHATFRQAPGSWALRPSAADAPGRLWLAGAWTDTGWPDTMEGAVRSGVAAADAVMAGLAAPERMSA